MFGFDDSAIKTAEALSKLAAKHINQIKNAINSGKGAIKNPEGASKINVHAGENSEKITAGSKAGFGQVGALEHGQRIVSAVG